MWRKKSKSTPARPNWRPEGKILEKVLAERPAHEHEAFIQQLEKRAKRDGKLLVLREIQEYRRNRQPQSRVDKNAGKRT